MFDVKPVEERLAEAGLTSECREARRIVIGDEAIERRLRIIATLEDHLAARRVGAIQPKGARYEAAIGQR